VVADKAPVVHLQELRNLQYAQIQKTDPVGSSKVIRGEDGKKGLAHGFLDICWSDTGS
jgi:hypothetical protein